MSTTFNKLFDVTEKDIKAAFAAPTKKQKRLDSQCYLLQQFDGIQAEIKKLRDTDSRYVFQNFTLFESDPAEVINLYTPKNVQPFLEMTPAQRAILQPYIRFFKIIKGEKGENLSSVEFPFKIFSAAGEVIDTGEGGISAMERITNSGLGRIPDIGIKSFSFHKEGGWEQANVPNTIIARLQLYCNTIDALLLNYAEKGPDGKIEYPFGRTGQNPPPPSLVELMSYSDRVNPSEGFDCLDITSGLQDNKKMEIHAHVGWSVPPDGAKDLFNSPEEWQAFQNAVKKSRAVLILNLLKSNINLQSNGSIIVEAEYNARVESILENPELGVFSVELPSDSILKKVLVSNDKKQANFLQQARDLGKTNYFDEKFLETNPYLLTNTAIIKSLCEAYKNLDPNSPGAQTIRKEVPRIKSEIKKYIKETFGYRDRASKTYTQTLLLTKLMESEKIFHLDMTDAEFELYIKNKHEKNEGTIAGSRVGLIAPGSVAALKPSRQELKKQAAKAIGLDTTSSSFTTSSEELLESQKFIQDLKEKSQIEDAQERKEEVRSSLSEYLNKSKERVEPGRRRLSWFHLGDLLDLVLSNFYIKEKSAKESIKFIMGPYKSPVLDNNGQRKIYNLANLPISLDLFIKWWTENVIIPERTSYSLKNFIKDLISSIIAPATGERCLDEKTLSVPTAQSNYLIFHAPKDFSLENGRTYGDSTLFDLAERLDASNNDVAPEDLITYVYIYALDVEPSNRTGEKEEDERNGIYHLTYGLNKGVVRDIQFKRVETKGRRESLLEQNNNLHNIAQHSERYNATVRMEGNGIFNPGMALYIDPYSATTINHANTAKLANILGFGGYFYVKSIESFYEAGKFDTEMECIWTSPGRVAPPGVKPVKNTQQDRDGSSKNNVRDVSESTVNKRKI